MNEVILSVLRLTLAISFTSDFRFSEKINTFLIEDDIKINSNQDFFFLLYFLLLNDYATREIKFNNISIFNIYFLIINEYICNKFLPASNCTVNKLTKFT